MKFWLIVDGLYICGPFNTAQARLDYQVRHFPRGGKHVATPVNDNAFVKP